MSEQDLTKEDWLDLCDEFQEASVNWVRRGQIAEQAFSDPPWATLFHQDRDDWFESHLRCGFSYGYKLRDTFIRCRDYLYEKSDGEVDLAVFDPSRKVVDLLITYGVPLQETDARHYLAGLEPSAGEVAPPTGEYRTLVIDPPWPMKKIDRASYAQQGIALDYHTMELDEIAQLPIAKLALSDGCHVYLWVTQKFLPEGLALFEGWGVRYQCALTWVKPSGFTPFSWMYNTEHVLFGRVGSLDLLRQGLKLSFEAPVLRHSQKPDRFYELVTAASPEPRLDMFARREREGFTAWGDEVGQHE